MDDHADGTDNGDDAFDLTELAEDHDPVGQRAFAPTPFRNFGVHDHDDYDDEDDAQAFVESFSLPFLKNAINNAEPAPEVRNSDDTRGEGRIGSLLGSGNPFTARLQEFVRAKEPETDEEDFDSPFGDNGNHRQSFRAPTDDGNQAAPATHTGRLFDPPRAANPGNPREHSAASENALRGALETLRRLSGAA